MNRALIVLCVDSLGGLLVGTLVFALSPWLSDVYGWSVAQVRFVAVVNIGYGSYSGILALMLRVKHRLYSLPVRFLIVANATWGILCFLQVIWLRDISTIVGTASLIAEGIYVPALAFLELKFVLPICDKV